MADATRTPMVDGGLTQDLGWALRTLLRAYIAELESATAGLPGGSRGYQVLSIAAEGTSQNQASMAEQLGLDRTLMTYLVDGLETEGLVTRIPDPNDRRARRVTLTDRGKVRHAELQGRARDIERSLLAGLPAEEAISLRSSLAQAAEQASGLSAPVEAVPCAELDLPSC